MASRRSWLHYDRYYRDCEAVVDVGGGFSGTRRLDHTPMSSAPGHPGLGVGGGVPTGVAVGVAVGRGGVPTGVASDAVTQTSEKRWLTGIFTASRATTPLEFAVTTDE